MTETVIVNRIPETDGLRRARLALEAESQIEIAPETVVHVGGVETTVAELPEGVVPDETPALFAEKILSPKEIAEAAEVQVIDELVHQAATDLGFNKPTGFDDAPETPYSPAAEMISQALKMAEENRRTELKLQFEEFREQVIRAFKHLGLDTRKHFGHDGR